MFLYFASPNFYIFTILLICLFILLIQDSQPLQSVPNAVFIHVRGDIICRFQHLFTGITHAMLVWAYFNIGRSLLLSPMATVSSMGIFK